MNLNNKGKIIIYFYYFYKIFFKAVMKERILKNKY